jgi:aminopeptidase N
MRGELMTLPGESYLAEQFAKADPGRIYAEREALKAALGRALAEELLAAHNRCAAVPFALNPAAKGARRVKTAALGYLAASDPDIASKLAHAQYTRADNMTDRQGALMVLSGLQTPERTGALIDFYNRFQDNPLVIDKWFALQAMSLHPEVIAHVEALAKHPDFTLRNPNRVRSLYMAFASNAHAFQAIDGRGYRMIADLIIALDPINPQTAARFVPPLGGGGGWRTAGPP